MTTSHLFGICDNSNEDPLYAFIVSGMDEQTVLGSIRTALNDNTLTVPIVRRRNGTTGDFTIPICSFQTHAASISTLEWASYFPAAHVAVQDKDLTITIDRVAMYKAISQNLSGHMNLQSQTTDQSTLLNLASPTLQQHDSAGQSLSMLRGCLIVDHARRLLGACGYKTRFLVPHSENFQLVLESVGISGEEDGSPLGDAAVITLVHGGVSSDVSSADALLKERLWELEHAMVLKYGALDTCVVMPHSLLAATIRFEILLNSCPKRLKICSKQSGVESRPGVFVMYNCARLAALHNNFLADVAKGKYPELPASEDIDWHTLSDKEWVLMFNYIVPYPQMVKSTIDDFNSNSSKPAIHTHKVCQFLHKLCREVSSYYRHTRILCGAAPHLLPIMFARLTLLQCVHTVICNGLNLLNIEPPTRL